MKKKIFFLVILFLYFFYINYYLPSIINKNLKSFFFLYFREKVNFNNIYNQDIFFPVYKIKNISGENFYIESIKFNIFTKKAKIVYGVFNEGFKSKVLEILKNFSLLNVKFKELSFISTNFIENNNIFKNLHGKIFYKNNHFYTDFSGFVENKKFNVEGEIFENARLNLNLTFSSIKFKDFFENFLKLPFTPITSIDKKVNLSLNLNGYFFKIDNTEVKGNFLNEPIGFSFILKNINNNFSISDGVIKFFNDDNNLINFYGKIFSDNSWSFTFDSKCDFLKIPYNNSFIKISDLDFNYSLNNVDGNEIDILKLYSSEITDDNKSIYKIFNYLWNKRNFSYNFFIDKLNINNNSFYNLDIQLNSTNGIKSIDKFNFNSDKGKILFSLIKKENNLFRIAISSKNISLKKVVNFLFNKNLNIDGNFNINFLGFGKDNIFNTGRGNITGGNIIIKGIDFNTMNEIFANHDIKNIKLYDYNDNTTDNETNLKILLLNSKITVNNHKLNFKDVTLKSTKFILKLNGNFIQNDLSNIILTGNYNSKDVNSNAIININLKEKFIQIIGK